MIFNIYKKLIRLNSVSNSWQNLNPPILAFLLIEGFLVRCQQITAHPPLIIHFRKSSNHVTKT